MVKKQKLTYSEARDKAQELHRAAHCGHPGFNRLVVAVYKEGSFATFANAFLVRLSDEYSVIISEHQGTHVVVLSEVYQLLEYEQAQSPPAGFKETLKEFKRLYDA